MTPAQAYALYLATKAGLESIASSLPGADVHPEAGLAAYNTVEYQTDPTTWGEMAAMGFVPPALVAYLEQESTGPSATGPAGAYRDPQAAMAAAVARAIARRDAQAAGSIAVPILVGVAGLAGLAGLAGVIYVATRRR